MVVTLNVPAKLAIMPVYCLFFILPFPLLLLRSSSSPQSQQWIKGPGVSTRTAHLFLALVGWRHCLLLLFDLIRPS